jgi:hypothetical protein
VVKPRGAGSLALAWTVRVPIVAVAPARQSWSGQRTSMTMPPVVSGRCVRAMRASMRGGVVSSVLGGSHLPAMSARASSRWGW